MSSQECQLGLDFIFLFYYYSQASTLKGIEMIVYRPKERFGALKLFDVFVDFIIQQLREDKIEIDKMILADYKYCSFNIMLVRSDDREKRVEISFSYDLWRGFNTPTPIERFQFTLCQGGIVKGDVISQYPDEYDKMLELFRVCLNYLERHDPERYKSIIKKIDVSSLERNTWKKSKKDIEEETSKELKIRVATEDFYKIRRQALADLIDQYKSQGYEITE